MTISGTVQGVGFRPFVYNLAVRLGITGHVANTSEGVLVEVQGKPAVLSLFLEMILTGHPLLAHPKIMTNNPVKVILEENDFVIQHSQTGSDKKALITPDATVCEECLQELNDPTDRRYRYPFINCTHCGPRFTIISDVPYDRPNTTMRPFQMCDKCQGEYDNPADRRFHAQPNACSVCGPHLWLTDTNGKQIETTDPVKMAIDWLEQGNIVAIKGLGGFHLAVRADSDQAVGALRERKYRKAKSFAVMVRDIDAAMKLARVDPVARELLLSVGRPVVLCPGVDNEVLSDLVAPTSRYVGIMLPYTPLHVLLMAGNYPALVMTSGNNSDEPIECSNEGALEKLGAIADGYLMHNRDIYTSCDDSVVKTFQQAPQMIRRARGFVPAALGIDRKSQGDILAVGAELKNTVTFVKGPQAFVSQHIGDLGNATTYESFLRTVEKLGALTGARPRIIACDMHPSMLSTRFAQSYEGVRLIKVQHHHAHIAAVMGEYNLPGPVVGIVADGVGYGTDQTVWGCEAMAVWPERFERKGYLQQIPMPGGDAASRQPWRMAVSYLVDAYGLEKGVALGCELLKHIDPKQIEAVGMMIGRGVNSPLTSSLGRLFDGVSALLGVCMENSYEAQGAIELENRVDLDETLAYPIEIAEREKCKVILLPPVIDALVKDINAGIPAGKIAGRFHNFIIGALEQMALSIADELSTDCVALSGGVFQNDLILSRMTQALKNKGLLPYFSRKLPVNDGGISYGQAVVADAIAAKTAI
ncbi:MAG: carbamoyltransferase HypF [Phycisphaerae bacterium]|nr:carbamoyltransferase HypF [Phycisphaerae bacterium]